MKSKPGDDRMHDFSMDKDDNGVAVIKWDVPDKSMNVLSAEGPALLSSLIDDALADNSVTGIVLTSGKPHSFAGGMDLNVLARIRDEMGDDPAQGLFQFIMSMHSLMRRIERAGRDPKTGKGGKPIACSMPGTGVGIGLELPLCTHRIFVADNPHARIGLPEIKVGLFPGAGGTTRLIRKLGLLAAAPYLFEGKLINPAQAKEAGIIDEVTTDPLDAASNWVLKAAHEDLIKPWDVKGYRIPGGAPYHPAIYPKLIGAIARLNGRTHGAFPAAKALMNAIYEGALVDFDTALKIECRWFVNLLMNPTSKAMIRTLFVNKTALEKGAARPQNIPKSPINKIGVIGAGMMGAGIALVSAQAGLTVTLIDQDQSKADQGKAYTEAYLNRKIAQNRLSIDGKEAFLKRISATTEFNALSDCDLIIEAVFEDPQVKSKIIQQAEEMASAECILASNTSTLPISNLAKTSRRPERFLGIHFFSPVEKMMLVEIIKGQKTDNHAVALALDYAQHIKKTPIVVNDARFFYANRCIIPYVNEGLIMAGEGINLALIDRAAQMLGFPIGPIQLVDETSLELGASIAKATMTAMGDAYPRSTADDVTFWMVDQKRLGRKSKAGFFDYDEAGRRLNYWPGFYDEFPLMDTQPDITKVQNRLIFVQVLEAVRAAESNVINDIREGDVGAVLGWGFPPWSGGPFSWLDIIGADNAAAECASLQEQYGDRFSCPSLLRDIAKSGGTFYNQFAHKPLTTQNR